MVDPEIIISLNVEAIEQQSKIFGPVFKRLVAQSMANFLADKLCEVVPKVDSLDEAIEYLRQNLSRYPNGYIAFVYGIGKGMSMLEGTLGAGAKMFSRSVLKPTLAAIGLEQIIGHVASTTEAVSKYIEFSESMGVLQKGLVSCCGDAMSCDLKISNCDYADACNRLIREGAARAIGGIECAWAAVECIAAEIIADKPHDYKMVKVDPPNCDASVFRVE